ncbi:replication initiator protein A [Wohlfahrtiimonas chitiniclastica]|uniref:plasmid replication initiator TrfA n=1 Tax=Wohlfahrtiimonas chitiniclastica TaxID=400946 RepID=UPI001BCE5BD0|nr:replication initiator protein A [Wohlfahrtiimonas chitiniclastica]MBS7835256.1 replication initiator protein A [Wohlfahrtiimonas chitiniclastica]
MDHNNSKPVNDHKRDPYTVDWINDAEKTTQHLNPIKHPQKDFFIADIFDAISLQLDMASMEYPLFALKAGDKNTRRYKQNGFSVVVAPSAEYGMATIHDKDIWIYCISKLMQAMREGEKINRTVHFTIYDYLKTTNRGTSGEYYEKAKNALDRLAGTRVTTDIEVLGKRESRGFGLISEWKIVEEKDGRMIRVSVTLPEWLYRSITDKHVLTINPDYFRLRKPIDRRIYELARKHCGNNNSWSFNLDTLLARCGATSSLREFRRSIKSLATSNQLPDYSVIYNSDKDQVTFIKRVSLKNLTEEIKLAAKDKKPKRKRITEQEAAKLGRPGEEWPDLLKRIGSEYYVIFDKNRENL